MKLVLSILVGLGLYLGFKYGPEFLEDIKAASYVGKCFGAVGPGVLVELKFIGYDSEMNAFKTRGTVTKGEDVYQIDNLFTRESILEAIDKKELTETKCK